MPTKPTMKAGQPNQNSQASILDSVLDGSIHVGVKDVQDGSLVKLEALK